MLILDGAQGEGGGQILRTALTFSMVSGTPFRIENIRANRKKPGLMRQHLACVKAAERICGGLAEGAELGAQSLSFAPGAVTAGTYDFAIGSAGSTMLVLQTILLPLALADGISNVTISGGTHNPMAPHFDYVETVFLPLIKRMGYVAELTLQRRGFYPAGGGGISIEIGNSSAFMPLELVERGELLSRRADAFVVNIPYDIAKREIAELTALLDLTEAETHARSFSFDGNGNIAWVQLEFENLTEMCSAFGEFGRTAEHVAGGIAREVKKYLHSGAAVGSHLADQLLLPLVLGGGGRFTTSRPTPHFTTNKDVIEAFLPGRILVEKHGEKGVLVTVAAK